MRIKTLVFISFLVLALQQVLAQKALDYIPQPAGNQLFSVGIVNNTAEIAKNGSVSLILLPLHPQSTTISAELDKEKPSFALEALMFFPVIKDMPALYSILRSAGSMQGITYYSNSKKAIRVLYEESWAVQDPDTKKQIPDKVYTSVPEKSEYWMWQKDATLGGILYHVNTQCIGDWIYSAAYNITTVMYGIVPMIGEKKLNIRYLLIKTQDGIVLYAVMSAKPVAFPGISERYLSSLRNRINAVYSWFGGQLEKK